MSEGEAGPGAVTDRVAAGLTNFAVGRAPNNGLAEDVAMILDSLTNADRYISLHPSFARAFAYLRDVNWAPLISEAQGSERHATRHSIDGDQLYVSVDSVQGRGREGARLEVHRRYIDIQFTIDGDEEIGWKPLDECGVASVAYDDAKDVLFFGDRPDSWLSLPAGRFAIFFPGDAHAPLAGRGILTKAIVKIAIEIAAASEIETQRARAHEKGVRGDKPLG